MSNRSSHPPGQEAAVPNRIPKELLPHRTRLDLGLIGTGFKILGSVLFAGAVLSLFLAWSGLVMLDFQSLTSWFIGLGMSLLVVAVGFILTLAERFQGKEKVRPPDKKDVHF